MTIPWIVWIVIAVLALIGEVATTGLFLASIAVAALITAVVALVMPFVVVQVAVFGALSLLGILVIRPIVVSALGMDTLLHSGEIQERHLNGRRAVVTQPVDAHGGQVRIGQGEFWSARLYAGLDGSLEAGRVVEIMYVEGLTALVAPLEQETPVLTESSVTSGDN